MYIILLVSYYIFGNMEHKSFKKRDKLVHKFKQNPEIRKKKMIYSGDLPSGAEFSSWSSDKWIGSPVHGFKMPATFNKWGWIISLKVRIALRWFSNNV